MALCLFILFYIYSYKQRGRCYFFLDRADYYKFYTQMLRTCAPILAGLFILFVLLGALVRAHIGITSIALNPTIFHTYKILLLSNSCCSENAAIFSSR